MTQYTADLQITVDLNVIARYHTATKLKVDHLSNNNISTDAYLDTLKVFIIKNDGDDLHPAFDYWKYAQEAGLNELIANNLLYLFYVNCLYEWKVYSESLVTTHQSRSISLASDSSPELNLILSAREELLKIRDLCFLLESHPMETDIKFSYRSGSKKKGKGLREKYKALSIEITERTQVESLLKHAIEILFKAAQEGFNDILSEVLKGKQANYNTINEAINYLPIPPSKSTEAISSFRKHLITLCLDFIKQEINVEINIQTIPKAEVHMIYSLFSLMRLISPDLILKHTSEASRAKYIRSMAFHTDNISRRKGSRSTTKEDFFNTIEFE